MKVKLSINKLPLNGYYNIDPCPLIPKNYSGVFNIAQTDFASVNNLIHDTECEEIIADDIIDYVPEKYLVNFIGILAKKLRHNGKLIITGSDIEETIKMYLNRQIDITTLNKLIYGKLDHAWDYKNGGTTINILIQTLKSLGLVIESKSLNQSQMTIIARRK